MDILDQNIAGFIVTMNSDDIYDYKVIRNNFDIINKYADKLQDIGRDLNVLQAYKQFINMPDLHVPDYVIRYDNGYFTLSSDLFKTAPLHYYPVRRRLYVHNYKDFIVTNYDESAVQTVCGYYKGQSCSAARQLYVFAHALEKYIESVEMFLKTIKFTDLFTI